MSADVPNQKRALRAALRARRRLMTPDERAAAADRVADELIALVRRCAARTITCYLATAGEPETRPFITWCRDNGIRVMLPVSRTDGGLDWVLHDGRETVGLFGISEPVGSPQYPSIVADADVCIIPATAVDGTGMRLGGGRGYYDRALDAMPRRPPIVAVVFDQELVDVVPAEPHDQPVDAVVTPSGTRYFASRVSWEDPSHNSRGE